VSSTRRSIGPGPRSWATTMSRGRNATSPSRTGSASSGPSPRRGRPVTLPPTPTPTPTPTPKPKPKPKPGPNPSPNPNCKGAGDGLLERGGAQHEPQASRAQYAHTTPMGGDQRLRRGAVRMEGGRVRGARVPGLQPLLHWVAASITCGCRCASRGWHNRRSSCRAARAPCRCDGARRYP
jgi:hypothetical protein